MNGCIYFILVNVIPFNSKANELVLQVLVWLSLTNIIPKCRKIQYNCIDINVQNCYVFLAILLYFPMQMEKKHSHNSDKYCFFKLDDLDVSIYYIILYICLEYFSSYY